jgi:hypothetical protein
MIAPVAPVAAAGGAVAFGAAHHAHTLWSLTTPTHPTHTIGKRPAEMSLAEDQHTVGELGADGQHQACGVAVRLRTPRRDLDHLDARIR